MLSQKEEQVFTENKALLALYEFFFTKSTFVCIRLVIYFSLYVLTAGNLNMVFRSQNKCRKTKQTNQSILFKFCKKICLGGFSNFSTVTEVGTIYIKNLIKINQNLYITIFN